METLSNGFAKGVAAASQIAPDTVAQIESHVHEYLPTICSGEEFKKGIVELRGMYKEKDKKKRDENRIQAGVILGRILLNIIKVAIPGAGPILAIIGKALELSADPEKREKIRKNPGIEIAKLVIQ